MAKKRAGKKQALLPSTSFIQKEFLQDIVEKQDNVSRLVFADWAVDHGMAEGDPRIKLIRVQSALQQDAKNAELKRRARALLSAHKLEWIRSALPAGTPDEEVEDVESAIKYEGGLPHSLDVTSENCDTVSRHLQDIFRAFPMIDKLNIEHVCGFLPVFEQAVNPLEIKPLIRELNLDNYYEAKDLRILGVSGDNRDANRADLISLASHPSFTQMRKLRLNQYNSENMQYYENLFNSPAMSHLEVLELALTQADNIYTEYFGVESLKADALPQLKHIACFEENPAWRNSFNISEGRELNAFEKFFSLPHAQRLKHFICPLETGDLAENQQARIYKALLKNKNIEEVCMPVPTRYSVFNAETQKDAEHVKRLHLYISKTEIIEHFSHGADFSGFTSLKELVIHIPVPHTAMKRLLDMPALRNVRIEADIPIPEHSLAAKAVAQELEHHNDQLQR